MYSSLGLNELTMESQLSSTKPSIDTYVIYVNFVIDEYIGNSHKNVDDFIKNTLDFNHIDF